MPKKTIEDIDVQGKKVLLRVAYDISLKEVDGKWVVPDDSRIKATLPTIEYLLERDCSLVLLSWLKRPGGEVVEKYRMDPVAERLSELIKHPVKKLDSCVGEEVEKEVENMKPGEIIMLENVRFYPEEQKEDEEFSKKLASLGDLIVFDAFAQSHRIHSSTTGILKQKEAVAGFLMEKELEILSKMLESPDRPFTVILGGAKISDKLETTYNLLGVADSILIGGAMANAFLKAQGAEIQNSFVEDTAIDASKSAVESAQELLEKTADKTSFQGAEFIQLPLDLIAANSIEEPTESKVVNVNKSETLPEKWAYLDIGPQTVETYKKIIAESKTIFWNGPMGLFEEEEFAKGTKEIADAIVNSNAASIVGGGDTEKIVKMFGLDGKFTHVSTGGGASLEFLAGKKLPAVELLPDK
ncbi:phosphoglycerate kinase [Patescibacteria group bacterium]|nr:phosphoglycerate kinase [Patescibacteria group bacterium]MBU1952461.1 phosphoglycerate kinase [Patescibacteria group bacterium]